VSQRTNEGHTRPLKTLGWRCSKYGEGILDGAALQSNEKAFRELKG
jgi:hypothetical protein